MHKLTRKAALSAAVLAGLLGAGVGRADVKLQTVTHFGGIAGIGESDLTDVSYLQGHSKRTETSIKFTGAVLGTLQKWVSHGAQGTNLIHIYLLDQNKLITLNPEKKTYSEQPIYTPPQPGEQPEAQASSSEEPGTAPRRPEQSDVRVVKSEFKVRDTGKTRLINGFNCRNYELTWDIETENVKTHERGRSLMTAELWNSADARFEKVRREELDYSRAFVRLMHLPQLYSGMDARQLGLNQLPFATAQGQKELFDKLGRIKGYPVATDVKWEAGCTAHCATQSEPQQQPQEQSSGGLGGMLGGFLAKKLGGGSQGQAQNQANAAGMNVIFSSHTELESLDTAPLPASIFEVPAGYRRD